MNKLFPVFFLALMITISVNGFSQKWDKKSVERREFEILYKVCKEDQDINQNDFTDLFQKGLMEAIVRNGKLINGKVAELFVKIGIATPVNGVPEKVKTVVKQVKKPVKRKVKK